MISTVCSITTPAGLSLRCATLLVFCASLPAQSRPALINRPIDETQRRALAGNTRPEAAAANDAGAVERDLPLDHMLLQLTRPAADEEVVRKYIDSLHDPSSPNYHRWMNPSEFGAAFGVSDSDRAVVVRWLESHGLTVNMVEPGGMVIDFSGAAGQVGETFRTELHYLNVNGVRHIANMSDPSIPEALTPIVAGVVSLHDFFPRPLNRPRADYTFTSDGVSYQIVTPADLATIYDLNPLFAANITGQGQTIAVIEASDLYSSSSDWNTFRDAFGLKKYTSGNVTTIHPAPAAGTDNCKDPGVVASYESEAALDAEWAGASAPGAAIVVASCAAARTTSGVVIALQNLVNSQNPPPIMSISYGDCEAENGAAANAALNSAYQQAVAEGVSVFVAAGDEGAASCDAGAKGATHGIGVAGFASTTYNVAVGGTDFGDNVPGAANTSYWSSTNSATDGSAQSYIPEIPWNDSCASSFIAAYLRYTTVYGSGGACGSSRAQKEGLQEVVAGSGGPSGCATGVPAQTGVVGGTCKGYAKPSWQSGIAGIPSDGVRDIPDVSLFAADGIWGHYYVLCWSDVRKGGASCAGAPNTWTGAGGTSFAAPIFAGIQALVNQKAGGAQGNPNYVYYAMAAKSGASCNSSVGEAAGCIFHNVTQGDNDVNCGGPTNCFGADQSTSGLGGLGNLGSLGGLFSGAFCEVFGLCENYDGALSTSIGSFAAAYKAGTGWNFATGLGSVDAYELVTNWK